MNSSAQKLRIANIIEEGKLGGPQVRIANVAAALKTCVETTVVLPLENSERFRAKLEVCDILYKTFNLSRITKEVRVALRYLFFSWYEILQLVRYFRKENFDLVHVSGGAWQYKGVIAGKLAGRKVVWHLNDTSMPKLIRRLFVVFSRYADAYIFSSERSREYYGLLIRKGRPEFVIPAPVDIADFDPTHQYAGDEGIIQRWEGKIVIGTVANINPIKGLDVFITAAATLNKQVDNLVFAVVGPIFTNQRRYFERIRQLCKQLSVENVEFVGGREDVRPLLKRFDVYVCSSKAESSPISVWEAMAMAKPVVSTDVGDVPLYVRNGYNGFVVDVGHGDGLANRLAPLVHDEVLRKEFGRRAREIAVCKLDIKKCAQQHFHAYKNIIGI